MKIVKFKGGLGNQLFQYTFLRLLEIKYNCSDIKADFSYYENVGRDNVRIPYIKKLNVKLEEVSPDSLHSVLKLKRRGNPKGLLYRGILFTEKTINSNYYFESDLRYKEISGLLKCSYFDGYWQSWKYISEIKDIIVDEIRMLSLDVETERMIKKFESQNSVFLGVRRGDYISDKKNQKLYGDFELSYYLKAIEYIKNNTNDPVFYVFSNDIEWVKKNMNFGCEVIYRENADRISDIDELFLMAACKHAIIVNSTFYWWGAWLMNNPQKIVIAPAEWFANEKEIDIVPDNWIKL